MTKTRIAAGLLGIFLAALLPACVNDVEDGADIIEPLDDRSNEAFQGLYDCTERNDTGYTQGSSFGIKVVNVDAKPIEVDTANAYIAMQNAARSAGVNLRIVSGFRTNAEQAYFRSCYVNCNCNDCNEAARAGYSNHQSGHALDLNTSDAGVLSWLNNNGASYSFRRTVPSETWHWEWWGNDSDHTGPCGGEDESTNSPSSPPPVDCLAVSAADNIIDDGDACFVPGGPSQYLRAVEGQGRDDDLVWTGTTGGSTVSFAEWHVKVPARGRYVVEVYVDADVGNPSRQASYEVMHDGQSKKVVVSQQTTGWKSLGAYTFAFAAAVPQKVRLNDNTGEDSSLNRKLIFDAISVTAQECPRLEIVTSGGGSLNVRSNASTQSSPIGTLNDGEVVDRHMTIEGQAVAGVTKWHQMQKGSLIGFVNDAFVRCTQ